MKIKIKSLEQLKQLVKLGYNKYECGVTYLYYISIVDTTDGPTVWINLMLPNGYYRPGNGMPVDMALFHSDFKDNRLQILGDFTYHDIMHINSLIGEEEYVSFTI